MAVNLIHHCRNSKISEHLAVEVIQYRLILLLIVMGTISGCRSYYAFEDFGVRHYQAVSEKLGLTVTRLPSDTTFRRILQKLDFQTLAQQFEQWVSSICTLEPGV